MASFFVAFAACFVAILFGISGLNHLLRFNQFRSVLRSHGAFPPALTVPIASVVCVSELALAAATGFVLFGARPLWARSVFLAAAICGVAFTIYLRILLRHPQGVNSCGCSPFESPLSPLSVIPALALVVIASAGGLFAGSTFEAFPAAMGVAWGTTTALLVMLLPASFQEFAKD